MRACVLVTLLGLLAPTSGCVFDPAALPPGLDPDAGPPPPDATPTIDADPCAAEEVAANASHTCARRGDGLVWCWGNNELGQIASPSTAMCVGGAPCNPSPSISSPLPAIAGLGPGDMHVCAITPMTTVWCWGNNLSGQFGDGTSGFFTSSPTEIASRAGAVRIVGGETHICHQSLSSEVFCSGGNAYGQLGVGSRTPRTIPARVTALGMVTWIASGYRHMCAVRAADGRVLCWGANDQGQVSWQVAGDSLEPALVEDVSDVEQVTAGLSHSCALGATGGVSCWGQNSQGQLGDGTLEFRSAPVTVALAPPVDAISAGGNRTCALKQGEVFCWGESLGESGEREPLPRKITLPRPATSITSGAYHNCALLDDHSVWCWGWNAYGQLGDGMILGAIGDTPVEAHLCGP